jgi:hypothetical protein
MTTRITPGVGANLLGQHAAERNQDATAYVGNLYSQVLLFLKLCFVCRHLRLMLWLSFFFSGIANFGKYILFSLRLSLLLSYKVICGGFCMLDTRALVAAF